MVERFDEVVVGATVQAGDTLRDRHPCGHDEYGRGVAGGPQLLYEVYAVAIGKSQVDNEEVIGHGGNSGAKLACGRNDIEAIAGIPKRLAEQVSKSRTIF